MLGTKGNLRLRNTQREDMYTYLFWTNEKEVRRQSFNQKEISLSEHREWFEKRLCSKLTVMKVLVDSEGTSLGQIRFELDGELPRRARSDLISILWSEVKD